MLLLDTPKKTNNELVEDFDTFNEWHSSWWRAGYFPSNRKTWFDAVQDCHEDIRKKINDVTIRNTIELKNLQNHLTLEEVESVKNEIEDIVGNLMIDYGCGEDFLCFPYFNTGMKTSKFLLEIFDVRKNIYIRRHGAEEGKLRFQAEREKLVLILSKLGSLWAKAKTKEQTLYSCLDTSANGFVRLGHYDVDAGSCFSQFADRSSNKYRLANCFDTFVITVFEDEAYQRCVSRAWGFVNFQDEAVNFTNVYNRKYFDIGSVQEVFRVHAAKLLDIDLEDTAVSMGKIKRSYNPDIYLNAPETQFTFHHKDDKVLEQILRAN